MNDTYSSEHGHLQNDQEPEIHLRDYLRIITKRKMTVITFLVITFLTVFIATYTATPYYTASSHVLIEKNIGSNSLDRNSYYSTWDPDFLTTQFELIRSINVAHRVVDRLQLDTKYRHYFFKAEEEGLFTFISSLKSDIKDFIKGLLFSDTEEEENFENSADNSTITVEPKTDADIIAAMVAGGLSIKPVTNTKTVHISYSGKYPAMAQLIANAVVQAYIDETLEIKLASSNYSLQWMTSKAEEERDKLKISELSLQQYKRDNDLVTVENKLAIYPQKLAEFGSQLSKAQAEQKEYEALYAQIQRSGKDYKNIETIPIFAENNVLQGLREKIFTAEQKIKDLSKKYGHKHPVMINAKSEHNLLLKEKEFEVNRIIESTRNAYDLAKSHEENLKQLLADTKKDMLGINERFTQYTIMKREVDMNRVLYDALTSGIKNASVTEQVQDVKIWVIKKADLPGAPSKPNKKRSLALGLILGLCGGIGLAFFIEYLDNTVKNGQGIEQRFGLTVLGSVEELTDKSEKIETYLRENPLSPLAESYRLIRSGLLLSSPDHPPRSILITSMSPKEGKTSTTSNLARILAQNEKKVLIIDCDMRRPRMHSILGVPNSYGLSNYLSGHAEKKLIQTIPNEIMSLIPSGPVPPNPAELLNSERMKLLVGEMLKKFDFVLLDSPPIQSVTDSLTLSTLVDGTLLVTRSGKTTFDILESGLKKLYDVRAKILGVVLNGLNKKKRGGYYGYYGYYDYYSKENVEGEKRKKKGKSRKAYS
jgi:polysaccharide biosynthesis transport protein